MLARRLTTILPAMTLAEAIDTTRIRSVAGRPGARTAWVTTCPFRAPHHTISDAGLIGGGHVPTPGEGSLAHHGIFLPHERPEFRRHILEVLCQPLEKSITPYHLPHVLDLMPLAVLAERRSIATSASAGHLQA
jgi:magnesium chelatase family protein